MEQQQRRIGALLMLLLLSACGPSTACRVRERYGRVAGSFRVHRLARDGRVITIVTTGHGKRGRETFTYDGSDRLVRHEKEWSQEEYYAPHPSSLDRAAMSSTVVVEYTYGSDGKKRSAHRGNDVETYRWEGDQLVEVRRRGTDTYEWHLRWDGPRLLEARHVVRGRETMKFAYEYDARGKRVREVLTADFLTQPQTFAYEYDAAGRLVARTLMIDGKPVPNQSDRIQWDRRGRIVRLSRRDIVTSFTYDAAGRVNRIEHTGDGAQTFEYESGCTSAMTERLLGNRLDSIWNPVELM